MAKKIIKPKKAKAKAKKPQAKTQANTPTQRRMWLMYPPKLIQEPLIWQLGQKFKVVTNLRQASVTDEIGIVCLEVNGKRNQGAAWYYPEPKPAAKQIKGYVAFWKGVKVEN